jgi:hypothetical protein
MHGMSIGGGREPEAPPSIRSRSARVVCAPGMGLRDRLEAGVTRLGAAAQEAADAGLPGTSGDGFRSLRALFSGEDDRPASVEGFLLALVRGVRDDERVEDRSARDVFEAARRRRRRLGLVSFGAGPLVGVANQLADLYCETATVCELADLHGLQLGDEQIAAHLLVLWSVIDSVDEAQRVINGTAEVTVASVLSSRLRARVPERMNARTAIGALWKARGVVGDGRRGTRSGAVATVVLTGRHTKQLIEEAELQLGVRGQAGPNPQPPPNGPSALSSFGSYASKKQFLLAWAADVFRAAGRDPDEHLSGIEDMAGIAAFSQIWFRFLSMCDPDYPELGRYLAGIRYRPMLEVVDDMYATAVRAIANAQFDRVFEHAFRDCRAEYITGVRKGDFR